MKTYVDFAPPPRSPFLFQAELDGQQHRVQVRWNIFGQRWYVFVYDARGQLTCCVPRVGSPDAMPTASVVWDGTRQRVVVETSAPHGYRLGSLVDLSLTGALPLAFDGQFRFAVLTPTTLAYRQPDDPGEKAILQGSVGRDVDLVAGYFDTSRLVFRASSGQFEISP